MRILVSMEIESFASDPEFHSHVARGAAAAVAHAMASELPRPPRVPSFPPSVVLAQAFAVEVPAALVTTSAGDAATVRPGRAA
jgi:hypothetical protein